MTCLKRIFIASILLVHLFMTYAGGQEKLSLTTFGSAQGLSQNSIYSSLKDHTGLMWFATQDGLNRYDGYKITVYKHRFNDRASLRSNFITSLAEDSDGDLWIGTRIEGLSRFNRSADNFTNFRHIPSDPHSISDNKVNTVYRDRSSDIWIGTADGLNLLNPKTGKFTRYYIGPKHTGPLGKNFILAIYEDTFRKLWIGTVEGLYLLDRKSGHFSAYRENLKDGDAVNVINVITEDSKRRLWMGTNKGLKVLDRNTNAFQHFKVSPDHFSEMSVNPVLCIAKASPDKFWLGTNTTLQAFDTEKEQLMRVSDNSPEDNLMPDDGIYSLLAEDSGVLWIGTTSQGVLKHDRNLPILPAYKSSLKSIPTAEHIIRSMAEDQAGNIYLATDAGLAYLNRSKHAYRTFSHRKNDRSGISSNYTTAVAVSKHSGNVWVGTFNSGLDCYVPGSNKFLHYRKGSGASDLTSDAVYALLEDSKGNLWIGTDDGLNFLDRVSGRIVKFLHEHGNKHTIADNTIQALAEDSKGNIWIGGYNNGITIYNPATSAVSHINTNNSALQNNVISTFLAGNNGDMWVGTMEAGLAYISAKTKKMIFFQEQNGLVNNNINSIVRDSNGFIWLSTNKGITRLDVENVCFKNFNLCNGLKTLEFNLNSGIRLKSGEIAFGSINGFNLIDPKEIRLNGNKPKMLLTGFELFNKPVAVAAPGSPLKQTISTTKTLTLSYQQSVFTIRFAALDYTVPAMNRYAYKLEGFDDDWRYTTDEREATYTRLPPGEYVFKVIGSNNDGVWTSDPATLKIIITPPYWMTWWFRVLIVLLVAGLLTAAYKYRIRLLNRQKLQLQSQVEQRTALLSAQTTELHRLNHELQIQSEELQVQSEELHAQTDDLWCKAQDLELLNSALEKQKADEQKARREADLANLAKSTFLATMSHEIRTPMNGVLGMASLLNQTEMTVEQSEYTEAILNSGDSLLNVINDILDFTKIESGHMTLDPHYFNLRKCIDEVLELLAAKKNNLDVQLKLALDETVPSEILADSHRLKQVLTNLVGNATKFTSEGEVYVTVRGVKGHDENWQLYFEVQDTGIGMPADKMDSLFTPFNQLDSSIARKYGGSGLGLVISQRLVHLLGGTIHVESEQGKGSTFSFNIACQSRTINELPISIYSNHHEERETKVEFVADFALAFPYQILVAEDNLMNQKLIFRVLQKLGYSPDLAEDGQMALDMMAQKTYNLILMDVQMPNMDGLESTRRIRAKYGDKPLILAMTANALTEDRQDCFNAGMNNYLSKPINLEILIKSLQNMHYLL